MARPLGDEVEALFDSLGKRATSSSSAVAEVVRLAVLRTRSLMDGETPGFRLDERRDLTDDERSTLRRLADGLEVDADMSHLEGAEELGTAREHLVATIRELIGELLS